MRKFKKTFAVFLSCVMTLSTCMVSFAEEPETIIDTEVVEEQSEDEDVEAADSVLAIETLDDKSGDSIDNEATDTDAEELEELEIGANIDSYFKVPYVSTYYFNPKPTVNDNIQIPLYLTDYDQSEYLKNDTSKKLDLIYEVDGVSKTIKDVPLGDYTLTIGKLSAGTHSVNVQVLDKITGMKSHKVYNDLLVITGNETVKLYTMTASDLTAYKINNKGSENANDCKNTRDGLTKLFADKQAAGYTRIKLLYGTYRVDCEKPQDTSDKTPYYISIPSHFTVDLNGSTLKLKTITTDLTPGVKVSGLMIKMDDVEDAHLTNGIIEGDRLERQNLGLEVYDEEHKIFKGEQVMTIQITGGKYCSLDNLTIQNTDGYTVGIGGIQGHCKQNYSFSNIAILDGKEYATDKCCTTDMVDLSKIMDADDKGIYVGKYLGYRGLMGDSPIVYVSFYDANQNFIETITGYQFRKMNIPVGAKYARATLLGSKESLNSIAFVSERYGEYHEIKDITFVDTRTCALVPTACNNLLIDGCTYTRCGNSITALAVDMEDGWEECQDLYYRNNKVLEAAGNATLVDCAGFNHVYENNIGHNMEFRTRLAGAVVRNHSGDGTAIKMYLGSELTSKFSRIYNNEFNNIKFADGSGENHECVNMRVKNCTISNGEKIKVWIESIPTKVVFEGCNFLDFAGASASFNNCTIHADGKLDNNLYFYNCIFKNTDVDEAKQSIYPSGAYNATRIFDHCTFQGKTEIGSHFFATGNFKNCEFEDISFSPIVYEKGGDILFDTCKMNSSADEFIHVGPFAYSVGQVNMKFVNCDIVHTGKNLIYFFSKPSNNSEICFDNCTINKSSGSLVKWLTGYDLNNNMDRISVDVIFKNTSVDKSLTIDPSVDSSRARVQFLSDSTTTKKNGILTENGKIYYYVDDVKQLGWKQIAGAWHYFGVDGVMATSKWVAYGSDWYYFDEAGVMLTNKWLSYKGSWYYFDEAGTMLTNKWLSYKGSWYYFDEVGAMLSNKWLSYKSTWYYFGDGGIMLTNKWLLSGGKWYYFNASGMMVTGKQLIGGKTYNFSSSGAWIN